MRFLCRRRIQICQIRRRWRIFVREKPFETQTAFHVSIQKAFLPEHCKMIFRVHRRSRRRREIQRQCAFPRGKVQLPAVRAPCAGPEAPAVPSQLRNGAFCARQNHFHASGLRQIDLRGVSEGAAEIARDSVRGRDFGQSVFRGAKGSVRAFRPEIQCDARTLRRSGCGRKHRRVRPRLGAEP